MNRWCAGPCGRELPAEAFRSNRGTVRTECRQCERFKDRTRKRARYRRDPKHRAARLKSSAAYYRRSAVQ